MTKDIIVVIGSSNAGKDSLARAVEKWGYNFIVSVTSRPMRTGESQNNPYEFVSRGDFLNSLHNDEMIEHRAYQTLVDNKPDTWYYGVKKTAVKEDTKYVVVLDLEGYKEFKDYCGDRIISFFIEASEEIRKDRCIKRGDYDETEFNRRLEADRNDFPSDIIDREVDFRIQSTNIEDNLESILRIVDEINLEEILETV